ncbi:transglutaminase domain-containing protein [Acidobacteria bacterium AB60]|nr:transglutaminase domain-containing protein [Acidobacteria bacterium AB60]
MDRREFLRTAALSLASTQLAPSRLAWAETSPPGWQEFEITTKVEVLKPAGTTRVWIPLPSPVATDFQRPLGNQVDCPGGTASTVVDRALGMALVSCTIAGGSAPTVTAVSRAATRNRSLDLSGPDSSGTPAARRRGRGEPLQAWLPPKSLPADDIVRRKALEVTRDAHTDLEKARAIYEWIVVNTYRNPKTRGCGRGDIRYMLESGDLGGKCADLNALFVGLARGAGLPARDAYGIRVAPSELGYKSLGAAASGTITKAQHCRAEVHVRGRGWIPVDPADVRKVMLEEPPGNLPLDDEKVEAARRRLFGSWEMNWVAYNFATDVELPGARFGRLPFFMYPQAETAEGRLDCLDPDSFRYTISARKMG